LIKQDKVVKLAENKEILISEIDHFIGNFDFKPAFVTFFLKNLISTPNHFKKLKSLKRKNLNLYFMKIINFFFKKGQKEKYFKKIIKSLNFFFIFFEYNFITKYKINLKFKNLFLSNFSKNNKNLIKKFNYD
jgi:hypothetical protein